MMYGLGFGGVFMDPFKGLYGGYHMTFGAV